MQAMLAILPLKQTKLRLSWLLIFFIIYTLANYILMFDFICTWKFECKTYVDWHATMEEGVWCWYYYAGKCSWNLGHLFGFCFGRFEYKEHDMLLQWLVGLSIVSFFFRILSSRSKLIEILKQVDDCFISRGHRKCKVFILGFKIQRAHSLWITGEGRSVWKNGGGELWGLYE